MTTFFDRTKEEQELIRNAYQFEMEAIKEGSSKRNPYCETLKTMGLWEALNEAVEMAFN